MHLNTVVNWVPYGEETAQFQNQKQAHEEFLRLKPAWADLIVALLPAEKRSIDPKNLPAGAKMVNLTRQATGYEFGDRCLPFVTDLMDCAKNGSSASDWIGVLNTDILVSPKFFEAIERLSEDTDVILVHRTDIDHINMPPEEGIKVNRRRCADGFFTRSRFWEEHGHLWSGFVLGAPWWDTWSIWFCNTMQISVQRFQDHECLHVNHPRKWRYREPASIYNSNMSKARCKEVLALFRGRQKNDQRA